MTDWYRRQRQRDAAARSKSEAALGPEGAAFREATSLLASCLDTAFATGADDLVTRRKTEFASHALNILWSAWDEALCGRFDASDAHSRSISESREFLLALYVRPALAEQLGRSQRDIDTARNAIRDAIADHGGPGKEFHARVTQAHKALQPLAHVTHEVTGGVLAVIRAENGAVGVLRPGGGVSTLSLRLQAIPLALDSLQLLGVAIAVFDVVPVGEELWNRALERIGAWTQVLAAELRGLAPDCRVSIGRIHLARAGEEVDGVW